MRLYAKKSTLKAIVLLNCLAIFSEGVEKNQTVFESPQENITAIEEQKERQKKEIIGTSELKTNGTSEMKSVGTTGTTESTGTTKSTETSETIETTGGAPSNTGSEMPFKDSSEENKMKMWRNGVEILNEILIASITGFSENPLALQCAKYASPLALILKCPKRVDGGHTLTLLDYYVPEHRGLIASTTPYNASEENSSWLDEVLSSDGSDFAILQPEEFIKSHDKAEKYLESEGIFLNSDKQHPLETGKADKKTTPAPPEDLTGSPPPTGSPNPSKSIEPAKLTESIEQEEDFENDLDELESLLQSSRPAIEEAGTEKNAAVPEKKIKNADDTLSLYSYGNELFSIKERGNQRIAITSFEKKLLRQYFDDKMRIMRRETWDLSGGINGAHKTKTEVYVYNGDSLFAERSTTIEGDSRSQQKYDENGRIIEQRNFTVLKDSMENQDSENTSSIEKKQKIILNSRTTWKYNTNGTISEKYFVEYTYRNENPTQVSARNSKKEVYAYKIQDGSPDYSYYENDVLRMKTEYSALNDYKTTSYFDDGFVVESYYEGGMHKRDYYYSNGSLIRSRDYE